MDTLTTNSGLGNAIRELREQRGLTQRTLAQEMNVSVTCLSYIERSERNISERTLLKAATALNVSPLWIRCLGTCPDDLVDPSEANVALLKSIQQLIKSRIRLDQYASD